MGPSVGECINQMQMFWNSLQKAQGINSKCTQIPVLIPKRSVEQEVFGTEYDL